ncbi:hypothetical protein T484DRAFT_2821958 [Baffinella frigidus]|nr:hypothetical protein T484DRAFT_2821958 [Cryptophyta sp. CCMP2293]
MSFTCIIKLLLHVLLSCSPRDLFLLYRTDRARLGTRRRVLLRLRGTPPPSAREWLQGRRWIQRLKGHRHWSRFRVRCWSRFCLRPRRLAPAPALSAEDSSEWKRFRAGSRTRGRRL